jgi:hypothetical protein
MLTVGEIVSLDSKAQFRNDVQLDAYESPDKNLALLHSYLFSKAVPNGDPSALRLISSLNLLDEITNAFLSERLENRMVVVANYGHGKSHLALTLANYFGRPTESQETEVVLGKINHTLADEAKAARYLQFKENRAEFLTVRLRGDVPQSLPTQFLLGLEKALEEHEATRDERLPFWYEQAESILAGLTDVQRAEADAYLHDSQMDAALLLSRVQAREHVYDEVVGAIKAALGVKPDLREVSLSQTVEWAAKKFTGPGKPLGGMLILFDEFSLYISKYAHRHAAADLQDLLNGVEKNQGRVVFLAFAQFDPLTTAENLTSLSINELDDLKKALTRLPRKYALYSLMESVIDAYLKQPPKTWQLFTEPSNVRGSFYQASQIAWDRFRKRYDQELQWDFEKFRQTVTDGAFPLHPITTALLCNVTLGAVPEGGVPRTVLGFVMEQLQHKQDEAAVVNGRPNWVLPISLVDYFEGRLDGELYSSYRNALRTAGADVTPAQEAVLKALLMQEMAGITARAGDQSEFLWHSSGLGKQEAAEALQTLAENNSIRRDPVRKTLNLWPVSADPQKLEKTLRGYLDKLRFDEQALAALNSLLRGKEMKALKFGSYDMAVKWGHQTDWAAIETIVSADMLTLKYLRSAIKLTEFASNGTLQEGDRGYVFWLLARNEEELERIRRTAAATLDKALEGMDPPPIVLMIPESPNPELVDQFRRLRALKAMNNPERQGIGADVYLHELDRVEKDFVRAVAALRADPEYPFDVPRKESTFVVPQVFRAQIGTMGKAALRSVLDELYRMAYVWRPPEFDTRYRVASQGVNRLRTAAKNVAGLLLLNSPQNLKHGTQTDPIARDLRDRFLQKSWRLLTPNLRIQKPSAPEVARAWEYLDMSFAAGNSDVRLDKVLVTLLNPKFGFDYNTATLLFCAWFGYSALDLQVSRLGKLVPDEELSRLLDRGAKDFMVQTCSQAITVSRRDRSEVENSIRKVMSRVHDPEYVYEQAEAEQDIAELETFAEDGRASAELRDSAQRCAINLKAALEDAKTYDNKAFALEQDSRKIATLAELLGLYRKVAKLPRQGKVATIAPPVDEVRKALIDTIEATALMSIQRRGQMKDIAEFQLYRQQLENDRKQLEGEGIAYLGEKIEEAIRLLQARHDEMRQELDEAPIRREIESMLVAVPLNKLYEYRQCLNEVSDCTKTTLDARDGKLEQVEAEIARLEREIEALRGQVREGVDSKSLRRAHESALRVADRYKQTDYETDLDHLLSQLSALTTFLTAIEELRNKPIATPDAAQEILTEIHGLESKWASELGEKQQSVLEDARTLLLEQVEAKQAEASSWIGKLEVLASREADLSSMIVQLRNPPIFLPEGELARLDALRSTLEERLAQDLVMQIETRFRELPDDATRLRCLAQLQKIVSEGSAGSVPASKARLSDGV